MIQVHPHEAQIIEYFTTSVHFETWRMKMFWCTDGKIQDSRFMSKQAVNYSYRKTKSKNFMLQNREK